VNPELQAGAVAARTILRRAVRSDCDDLSSIWLRSFAAALPSVPKKHTDDEVRAWVRDVLTVDLETWVASIDDNSVGLLSLDDGEIEQFYLDPDWQGRGIGGVCIRHAKQRYPNGLGLWTFEVNTRARHFYASHGFAETVRTDGSRNEEGAPDVRMEWRRSL
jgi:GNAT superfamily N-acetyltransferase